MLARFRAYKVDYEFSHALILDGSTFPTVAWKALHKHVKANPQSRSGPTYSYGVSLKHNTDW